MIYPMIAVDEIEQIERIVLNYPAGWGDVVRKLVQDYAIKTPVEYVEGSATRQDSVRDMLDHVRTEHVVIHETARPLVSADDFVDLISQEHDNVSFMLPIPFTVAPVDPASGRVTGALDRDRLRNVQLPQKFRTATVREAHAAAASSGEVFTEDATLCAVHGADVRFIPGLDRNFKITTSTDVRLAGFLLTGVDENE